MSKRIQILIVEDDPVDAELLVLGLKRAGFDFDWERVHTEPDYLGKLRPGLDLIFSDCKLPQFSGHRALELLKKSELEIPFIVLSGSIDEQTAESTIKDGAAYWLMKGQMDGLKPTVRKALGLEPGA